MTILIASWRFIKKMDGYSKNQTQRTSRTIIARFKEFRDRYRVHVAITIAVISTIGFIATQIIPSVEEYIFSHGIIEYLILLIVLDLTMAFHSQRIETGTWILENQDESLPKLLHSVRRCKKDGVDLLEYAGATILPLIREIQRKEVPLRMLVQHPDQITGIQKQRLLATLDTILNSIYEDSANLIEIRCYKLPFTMRGRRLGNELIEIGWLTPDLKRQTAYGHQNPSIHADLFVRENEHFRTFFERTFEDLWNHEETKDGRDVLSSLYIPQQKGVE